VVHLAQGGRFRELAAFDLNRAGLGRRQAEVCRLGRSQVQVDVGQNLI